MKGMIKRYLLYGGALLLLLAGCQKKEIPVDKIVVTPEVVKLFVGDTQEIQVECYPSSANNLDLLTVANSNPEVADFENGKLLADFQLSNGFTFTADWEGYPAMKTE